MSDQNWQRVEELLHQALALAADQRAAFVEVACGSDALLLAELESLLLVDDEMSVDYLKSPLSGEVRQRIRMLAPGDAMSAGQIFAERFELIRKLGEGGMGQVWLAAQIAPVRRQVALKLIKAGMYDEAVAHRFQSERQSIAMMDHPAIAKVFDAGTTPQGQPYLIMEYVAGLPITDYCDQHKLSIKDRLAIFIQACEGVQHAHQKAIIHRDLKPSNILVIEVDDKRVPRIIDFGLAKTTAPQISGENLFTQFGQFIGTPGYMSPEQVDQGAQDIDTRTDVYSLGVVLYVLLTGLQPFETKRREKPSLEEWLRRLREDEPPNPSTKVSGDKDTSSATADARRTEPKQLISQLRGDLDWVTMKSLERNRERRYGAPSDLAADLKRFLNHEPVLARPASAGHQLRKFVRRHRIAAAFFAMASVLSIISSTAALIAMRQKHAAEFQATQTLQAQSRLLIQAAGERLNHSDVAGAQGIILAVLTNREFLQAHTPAAINVFQEIRAADGLLAVLSGHSDIVYFAAYSPDGTRVVTASRDHTARIWDARTGVQLAVLSGHADIVYCATYSPDGSRVVTASRDHTARIWDAYTGRQIAVLSGHSDGINSVAYSPNGTRIVTASFDQSARIWDARTGAQLAMLSGHRARLYSGAYSPDGARIVTASWDKTVRIWDARTGAQLRLLSGHDDRVYSAIYSPDGTRIVSASWDKTARIWDARTGAQLAVLSGHGDAVASAVYSPDASRILTASWDKTARIWDARTGVQLAVLSGHDDIVYSAAYSPDGSRILTASWDKTARIWDITTRNQLAIIAAPDRLYSAAYSPDALRVITASEDQTACIWDARTGAQIAVLSGHEDRVFSAAYSPNGTRIVTASNDKSARIWDAYTGTQLALLSGHVDSVDSVAYSPDGAHIVTASFDKSARIWDADTVAQLTGLSGHTDLIYSAAYSPDGSHVVTASRDKTARIWDAHTGAQLAVLSGHSGYVSAAGYSPDGTRIVTASYDKTARIWDAASGAQLTVLSGHADSVFSAAYSRDGSRIVTASRDKSARIWDARTGAQLTVLSGHQDALASAAYSPDGTRIVTASADHTARIWDARVQADIPAQILWDAAAAVDPLPSVDRTQLGLPPETRIRIWGARGSACDLEAAAFYDPERLAAGLLLEQITIGSANEVCSAETIKPGHAARLDYELGRALLAKGDVNGARRQFELAIATGYPAARVDLADLLSENARMLDLGRALSLYEQAWQQGVPIAAFKLGHVFEYGSPESVVSEKNNALRPDTIKAWLWYERGSDAGDPNALARFAERDEKSALAETDESKRNELLLQAFSRYAAAAGRAYEEAWPNDAWKYWRYRRATLARLLARQGMMQQVADAYGKVLEQRVPERTLWERIKNTMHF